MSVESRDIWGEYNSNNHKTTGGIEYWVKAVKRATEEMPKKRQAEMPPTGDPAKETQRAQLLERHKEARAILELIEEQLLKLDYEIHQEAIAVSSSSQQSDSNSRDNSLLYVTSASELDSGESQNSFVSISLDSSNEKPRDLVKDKKKKKRSKRPKTEEEKNRHINKVFMRENGIIPR
ncbi:hypothetical protein IL306_010278 [Fusarium sp. DS 682]|nr:hypothetical protein IL306_010278 [Fusarium sp. DS 682]